MDTFVDHFDFAPSNPALWASVFDSKRTPFRETVASHRLSLVCPPVISTFSIDNFSMLSLRLTVSLYCRMRLSNTRYHKMCPSSCHTGRLMVPLHRMYAFRRSLCRCVSCLYFHFLCGNVRERNTVAFELTGLVICVDYSRSRKWKEINLSLLAAAVVTTRSNLWYVSWIQLHMHRGNRKVRPFVFV